MPVDKGLPKNLLFASIIQAVLLVGSAAAFDEGRSFRVAICSTITFWIVSGWIALRRRNAPTHGDLIFAKYGFIGILFVLGIFGAASDQWNESVRWTVAIILTLVAASVAILGRSSKIEPNQKPTTSEFMRRMNQLTRDLRDRRNPPDSDLPGSAGVPMPNRPSPTLSGGAARSMPPEDD